MVKNCDRRLENAASGSIFKPSAIVFHQTDLPARKWYICMLGCGGFTFSKIFVPHSIQMEKLEGNDEFFYF